MLADAVRQYPVITLSGKLRLVSYVNYFEGGQRWVEELSPSRRQKDSPEIIFHFRLYGARNPRKFFTILNRYISKEKGHYSTGRSSYYFVDKYEPVEFSNPEELNHVNMPFLCEPEDWFDSRNRIYTLPTHFYVRGVGFDDAIVKDPGTRIRGMAMWEDFPFESLKKNFLE